VTTVSDRSQRQPEAVIHSDFKDYRGAVLAEEDLYALPEGTVLWKPEFGGWALFLKTGFGEWTVIDAYDRDYRGRRYTVGAIGAHSRGSVLHTPPPIGYYSQPPAAVSDEEHAHG
jgi:hypothetical protein